MKPLNKDTLGPANFDVVLLLDEGCLLSEVKMYYHSPVGLISPRKINQNKQF